MKNCLKQISLIGTLITVPIGLSLQQPANAELNPSARNQFDVCVQDIIRTGVTPDDAGVACSDALIPRELSKCVVRIKNRTPINPNDALQACYQVRRPVDLANCVSDIYRATPIASITPTTPQSNTSTTPETSPTDTPTTPQGNTTTTSETSPSLIVLDSCRRSLLPGRYSQCVIALSRSSETASPITAMNTCLSAEDFPRDLFPAYNEN